jgi:heme/copper-type cytochrome/quinol oxidase subunit 3
MPYVKGTREFALAVMVCGALLSSSSFYVASGEMRLKHRSLLGNKLLASSLITLLFGVSLLVGAMVYLIRR